MLILLEVVPTELTAGYHQNARQIGGSFKNVLRFFHIEIGGEREREREREREKHLKNKCLSFFSVV
jgi:hypothetical protein